MMGVRGVTLNDLCLNSHNPLQRASLSRYCVSAQFKTSALEDEPGRRNARVAAWLEHRGYAYLTYISAQFQSLPDEYARNLMVFIRQ
jgi:hypothetical protein